MKYKYLTLLMLGFCSLADAQKTKPAADATKDAASKPAKSGEAEDKIAGIIKEANDIQAAFMKRVRAEQDRAKAMKIYREERPDMAPFLKKILDIAKKDPKSDASARGLAWGYGAFQGQDKATAGALMMKHHIDRGEMSQIVSAMARSMSPDIKSIQGVMMASNNEKVRQSAMATLAAIYDRQPDRKADGIALYKQLEAWPNIAESNPKLQAHAKQQIFVAENLSIGKVAPDIVGTDEEDKEFKLSDYRGKVVMIDFWGIW